MVGVSMTRDDLAPGPGTSLPSTTIFLAAESSSIEPSDALKITPFVICSSKRVVPDLWILTPDCSRISTVRRATRSLSPSGPWE